MAAEPSALLPLARRGPFRLAIGLGMLQLAVLGVVAVKISFQPAPAGILGEGGSEVLLTHETRAIFGYFALVLLGILGTVWYVKARQPRGVLRLVAISALLANSIAVFLGDLLALAVPGLVFAFAVLITDQIGRRSRHAHGKPHHP
jgi:hypothetical protein